ncbi:MAG TPA: hypothetical protein VN817_01495 [Solirubrobacteraceae bacterium]|nr:hypothetical protein [Solirubrobacteraceae bacterium]
MTVSVKRVRVGISPACELAGRKRLWAALEATHAVRFLACDTSERGDLDAIVRLGTDAQPPSAAIPQLSMLGEEGARGAPRPLELADDPALARALRGAKLSDAWAAPGERGLEPTDRDVVLARLGGAPAWVLAPGLAAHHRVVCAPVELEQGEALRERLQAGRCLALLALVQFLRDLDPRFEPARPRAAFVIDDPNLHWPSYGHIRYAELLRHAREHGYHLAIAMTPLDGWLAHPRAVRVFREGAAHLSICIHGNDHDGPELGREVSWPENLARASQALSRSAAFAKRTGLTVERVMVPPHERLTEAAAQALAICGFQAICTTRPYPWIADSADVSWLQGPPAVAALSGWGPAELVAGGLPMLLRTDFLYPREDHVLRAFLGQPTILYGHHDLLADGMDVLEQATHELNRIGDVQWSSLGEIARAALTPGAAPSDVQASDVQPSDAHRTGQVAASPTRLRPVLRRLLSEGRDRLQAIG